jgi:hypothetical protein
MQRGGNGDLDAEFVKLVRLAFTDALYFRGMQAIDLLSLLLLFLA